MNILSHSFCRSRIQEWLSWGVVARWALLPKWRIHIVGTLVLSLAGGFSLSPYRPLS